MVSQPVKILLVDDEPNVLKALKRLFFEEENFELLTAQSGPEGLDIVKANPDILVIISDYRMPGMTGVEFLSRATELLPHTTRIVLSGYADTAAVVEAINIGHIYKFIPKPWDDDQLRVDINNAVEIALLENENRTLSEELEIRNRELETLNTNLEQEVEKRTASLYLRSKVLQLAQDILDSLPIGVLGIDVDNQIAQINEQAIKFLDTEGQVFLGERSNILPESLQTFIDDVHSDGAARKNFFIGQYELTGLGRFLDDDRKRGMIISLTPR